MEPTTLLWALGKIYDGLGSLIFFFGNRSTKRKTLNSNLLNLTQKWTLCYILLIQRIIYIYIYIYLVDIFGIKPFHGLWDMEGNEPHSAAINSVCAWIYVYLFVCLSVPRGGVSLYVCVYVRQYGYVFAYDHVIPCVCLYIYIYIYIPSDIIQSPVSIPH